MELLDLLREAHRQGASEVHLQVGQGPTRVVAGELQVQPGPRLTREAWSALLRQAVAWGLNLEHPGENRLGVPGVGPCRSWLLPGQSFSLVLPLPATELSLEKLHLPEVLAELAGLPQGLVLLAGPRRSGLSTTLAAMVDGIRTGPGRSLACLGPDQPYPVAPASGLVWQVETDPWLPLVAQAQSWCEVLTLPLADAQTAEAALQAAESGLLVLAEMRAQNAPNALDRLHGWLSRSSRRLLEQLRGVYAQQLIPRAEGRVPISEFLPEPVLRSFLGVERKPYPECMARVKGGWSFEESLRDWG